MTRRLIIAGNWKMYKTAPEAVAFIESLAPQVAGSEAEVYLAVPFTAIADSAKASQSTNVVIGAQNMNDVSEGAFTGEVAGRMLLDAGARFVVLGHSERRHIFGESSAFINKKIIRALQEGIEPLVCLGETLQQREAGQVEATLEEMVCSTLAGLDTEGLRRVLLAYEPVWAIGTGHTATPEQVEEVHRFLRQTLTKHWGEEAAAQMSVLYGGSVKPSNVTALMEQENVDGVLVGGASLAVEQFAQIVNYQAVG